MAYATLLAELGRNWWTLLIRGIIAVLFAAMAFFWPLATLSALVLLWGAFALVDGIVAIVVGAWAIARGVFEIVAAIRLRRELTGEWILIVSGIASIGFGALMMLFPGAGALALAWLIGLQALVAGVLMAALAFRLRGLTQPGGATRLRANA